MAKYFAQLDQNNIVTRVIVADQNFIDSGKVGNSKNWVETCMDGSVRKNSATKDMIFDSNRDAFIDPQPFKSWILNEKTCKWEAPIPRPIETETLCYKWYEDTQEWKKVNLSIETII